MTTITHFSHPEHPLIHKEEGFVPENKALCYGCDCSLGNAAVYSCTVCENWFLHKECAQHSTHITHLMHPHHPLILVPRMPSLNTCKICGSKPKAFAYRCNPCDFDVCGNCVYLRYPEHLLWLNEEDVVIGKDVLCDCCHESVAASTFYTSRSNSGKKYYLHRTCVELPAKINHSTHPDCELFLNLSLQSETSCDLCFRQRNSTFRCTPCDYDVCAKCAFKDRVIIHEGHKHHSLTFRYQEVMFHCHACKEKAEDSSYTCNTCDFWIHDSCASAPTTISATTYHHHPLHLIYSIPDMHLNFVRYCGLCEKCVYPRYWVYYCHRCTYFVHMRCATTWDGETMIKEIEGDCANDDPNLVQFPLPTDESLFNLLIHQFRKSQIDFKEVSSTSSVVPEDPPNNVNARHWSHTDHPLQEFHLSTFKDEEYDKDDEERLMVCDGCIQPISVAYPSFYGCIQCDFFLHKFCALLPRELPAEASPFHPQHPLLLHKMDKFYELINCASCDMVTNGFYYHCETCRVNVDIHCTLLPSSIKYEAHKFHSLVQRPASDSKCSISKMKINEGFEYGCKTCNSYHIDKACIFYPSRMKHRWDSHTVTLRYPPFFYEGVFYCQICEEQVDNNRWLYHCDNCDQSFHSDCLRPLDNVKVGQTIVLGIDNQKHTLTFVGKYLKRVDSAPYICKSCGDAFRNHFMLECAGCGYLVCIHCFKNRILIE